MAKSLTAASVAKLRAGSDRREVRDGACPGLYLTVQPSGVKSWTMRFRRPDGRSAKLTLGLVATLNEESGEEPALGSPLTLAAARRLATRINHQRAQGLDVVEEHKAERHRRRMESEGRGKAFASAAKQYITEHARPRNRGWRDVAKILGLSYPADDGEPTLVAGGLAERWRDKPIDEIDGHAIYEVVDECRRHGVPGLGRKNDGISDARGRHAARALSKMFGWLVQHRRIITNPCAGMYVPAPPASRTRVLTASELKSLWRACDQVGEPFGALTKVLLLTGARRDEVAGMTRSELSEDGATWTIPAARTKNKRTHVLPLAPLAREIIGGVRRIAGRPGYVFTTNGRTAVSGFSRAKARLDRIMGTEVPTWRLHDLRRTAVTGMAEIGVAPHVIEIVVNHVSGVRAGVAGTYNRSELLAERRAALERWALHLHGLVTNERADVVDLGRRRAR